MAYESKKSNTKHNNLYSIKNTINASTKAKVKKTTERTNPTYSHMPKKRWHYLASVNKITTF